MNIILKKKIVTVKEMGRHYLIQVIKIHIISKSLVDIMCLWYNKKGTSPLWFPRIPKLLFNHGKTSGNKKWGKFYKISDQYSSKLSGSWKTGKNYGIVIDWRKLWGHDACGILDGVLEQKKDRNEKPVKSK